MHKMTKVLLSIGEKERQIKLLSYSTEKKIKAFAAHARSLASEKAALLHSQLEALENKTNTPEFREYMETEEYFDYITSES